MSGHAFASVCDEAADHYLQQLRQDFGAGYQLLDVYTCHSLAGAANDLDMDLMMRSPDGLYVVCNNIKVRSGRVVDRGTCY